MFANLSLVLPDDGILVLIRFDCADSSWYFERPVQAGTEDEVEVNTTQNEEDTAPAVQVLQPTDQRRKHECT